MEAGKKVDTRLFRTQDRDLEDWDKRLDDDFRDGSFAGDTAGVNETVLTMVLARSKHVGASLRESRGCSAVSNAIAFACSKC